MRKIRGVDTKAEIILRKALWAEGIRYRVNVRSLPGKPDLVIGRHKIIIFIDGEFWHGYQWNIKKPRIKANRDYWVKKIEGNIARDRKNRMELRRRGYKVIRFWEHEVNKDLGKCVKKVLRAIDKTA